jgi:nitrous oxide reductase
VTVDSQKIRHRRRLIGASALAAAVAAGLAQSGSAAGPTAPGSLLTRLHETEKKYS